MFISSSSITYEMFSSFSRSASYIRQNFRLSLSVSAHLHSHAEPHSCSRSERSSQFELRSSAPSYPFLFPSTPNHHVPVPTLNLSFSPPLSVACLPPPPPPPWLLVPSPPTQLCPRQLFYTPLSTFLAKTSAAALPLNSGNLLVIQGRVFKRLPLLICFFVFQLFWHRLRKVSSHNLSKISYKGC